MIGMKDAKEKAIHIEELVKSGHSAPLRLLADELCADLSDATQELQEIYLRQ